MGAAAAREPARTCVGCRSKAPAGTLVRVARRSDGSLVASRDNPGRGAWLCRDAATGGIRRSCLDAAARRNAFSRAFRIPVGTGALASLWATGPPPEGEVAERANM